MKEMGECIWDKKKGRDMVRRERNEGELGEGVGEAGREREREREKDGEGEGSQRPKGRESDAGKERWR